MRHRQERHLDALARAREAVEAGGGAHALRQRALGGAANDGTVRERIGEREPQLDEIGASFDGGFGELRCLRTAHEVDRERFHRLGALPARTRAPRAGTVFFSPGWVGDWDGT